MCGIIFNKINNFEIFDSTDLFTRIKRRGPDFHSTLNSLSGSYSCSVLHLRGTEITQQPLRSNNGDILCYNGQIFDSFKVPDDKNDGVILLNTLSTLNHVDLREFLLKFADPCAFVFHSATTQSTFFGRDILGRRSLVMSISNDGIIVSSIPHPSLSWEECDATYLYELKSDNTLIKHKRSSTVKLNRQFTDSESVEHIPANVIDEFHHILTQAVDKRVRCIPTHNKTTSNIKECKLAVLFSGGIDCTMVAHLASKLLPISEPIELINVAFCATPNASLETVREVCSRAPDRQTALEAVGELEKLHSDREFRLVNVDISTEDYNCEKQNVIELMYPKNTVMDLSLAAPLYFASRGNGHLFNTGEDYTTQARVLLSGLGADEALGGYGRHRVAYQKGGWEGVADELEMDLDRLPSRNLGRDDRVIAHHSREVRFPFLAYPLLEWLSKLPLHQKADFRQAELGDKRLLRILAASEGLMSASKRAKRAMQFGSRSSRMYGAGGSKAKGDDIIKLH
ncbi:hypothetical protein E3P96_01728 [Wallemia ichthyophaga]|nr:hypothetical protein E3P96_01728 [Wallemia ichthyophaga]